MNKDLHVIQKAQDKPPKGTSRVREAVKPPMSGVSREPPKIVASKDVSVPKRIPQSSHKKMRESRETEDLDQVGNS